MFLKGLSNQISFAYPSSAKYGNQFCFVRLQSLPEYKLFFLISAGSQNQIKQKKSL